MPLHGAGVFLCWSCLALLEVAAVTHVVTTYAQLKAAMSIDEAVIDIQSDIAIDEGATAGSGLLVASGKTIYLRSTTGSKITRDSASPCKRFIYVSGELFIDDLQFSRGCSGGGGADCGGSAIWVGVGGSLQAKMTGFEAGQAFCNNGAAVHVQGSFVAESCYFLSNNAVYWNGGAIYVASTGTFVGTNCIFQGNKAGSKGSNIFKGGAASLAVTCTSRSSSSMSSSECEGCHGTPNCDGACSPGFSSAGFSSASHFCVQSTEAETTTTTSTTTTTMSTSQTTSRAWHVSTVEPESTSYDWTTEAVSTTGSTSYASTSYTSKGESVTHAVTTYAELKAAMAVDGAVIDVQSDIAIDEGATASSGLLVASGKTIYLRSTSGSKITRDSASPCKRFIYVSGELFINDLQFSKGCSGGQGADCGGSAIWVGIGGSLRATMVVFDGGQAFCSHGAAVHVQGSFVAESCYFSDNNAVYWNGGAIHVASTGTFVGRDCLFQGNRAAGKGSNLHKTGQASVDLLCSSRSSSSMSSTECEGCQGAPNCDGGCSSGFASVSHFCVRDTEEVQINGQLLLAVNDPQSFAEDLRAEEAVEAAVADVAGVALSRVSATLAVVTRRMARNLDGGGQVLASFAIHLVEEETTSEDDARQSLTGTTESQMRELIRSELSTAGVETYTMHVLDMSIDADAATLPTPALPSSVSTSSDDAAPFASAASCYGMKPSLLGITLSTALSWAPGG